MRIVAKNAWLCLAFGLTLFPLVHTLIALQIASLLHASAAHTTDFQLTCLMTGLVAGSILGVVSALVIQLRQERNIFARGFCFFSGITGIAVMLTLSGYNPSTLIGGLPWLVLPVSWCLLLMFFAIVARGWEGELVKE